MRLLSLRPRLDSSRSCSAAIVSASTACRCSMEGSEEGCVGSVACVCMICVLIVCCAVCFVVAVLSRRIAESGPLRHVSSCATSNAQQERTAQQRTAGNNGQDQTRRQSLHAQTEPIHRSSAAQRQRAGSGVLASLRAQRGAQQPHHTPQQQQPCSDTDSTRSNTHTTATAHRHGRPLPPLPPLPPRQRRRRRSATLLPRRPSDRRANERETANNSNSHIRNRTT